MTSWRGSTTWPAPRSRKVSAPWLIKERKNQSMNHLLTAVSLWHLSLVASLEVHWPHGWIHLQESTEPRPVGFHQRDLLLVGRSWEGRMPEVSFDGQAAFPSVDRDIQIRELFACGETGDLLRNSQNTYQNTVSQVKQDGKLGRGGSWSTRSLVSKKLYW